MAKHPPHNSPNDVLDPAAVETHEDKVLELGMHRNALVLLGRTADIDAVLRLALGDDARRPAGDHARGAVHRGHNLAADLPELGVRQPSHSVHERVQLLNQAGDRGDVGRHFERPVLAVLAALVKVLAVRAVAGYDIQRFA